MLQFPPSATLSQISANKMVVTYRFLKMAVAILTLFLGTGILVKLYVLHEDSKPSKEELGRSSWTLIHTMAANYDPDSVGTKTHAINFIKALAALYPCAECAKHFQKYIDQNPPDLSDRDAFLVWTCNAHNEINVRNSKQRFLCNIESLNKRWGTCSCAER